MQVFFNLSRVGIDGVGKWSKKKFNEIVTSYINTFEGVQIFDLLPTTNWDSYMCLIPVNDKKHALELRKDIEAKCKQVNSKCRPVHFMFHEVDQDIENVYAFGGVKK